MSNPGRGFFDGAVRSWMGQRDNEPPKNPEGNPNPGNDVNGKNNTDPNTMNDDQFNALWDEPKKKVVDPNAPPPPPAPAPKSQKDLQDEVSQHLKSVGLGPVTLGESDFEALRSGDPASAQGVIDKINSSSQQAYIQSVKAAQNLINNRLPDMVKEAVDKARGYVDGKELRNLLNTQLPFTKDKLIGPVAETVMQRALDAGATKEQALNGVKRFFERAGQLSDPARLNTNTADGYRGPQRAAGDNDWLDALTG